MHKLILAPAAAALLAAWHAPAAAQSTNGSPPNWTLPRTAHGHPDFQGVWANNIATPLERPAELEGRATLTDDEVAAFKREAAELFDGNGDAAFGDEVFRTVLKRVSAAKDDPHRRVAGEADAATGNYSSVWLVPREWDNRTSLITDPPDGRVPALTADARHRQAEIAARLGQPAETPADRSLSERCISYGSPQLLAGYQSYYRFVQSPDAVVVMTEMVHDARVIALDGSPHVHESIRQWQGDSRGRWEGDTLVVETTNYKPRSFRNSSDKLRLTERFTRVGPDTLHYEVTIDDPETWTKPWSLMIPLKRSPDELFEYACHEGNTGMVGILSGARAAERLAQTTP